MHLVVSTESLLDSGSSDLSVFVSLKVSLPG